jgi:hypothetical protein
MKPRIRYSAKTRTYSCSKLNFWSGFGATPEAAYASYQRANTMNYGLAA